MLQVLDGLEVAIACVLDDLLAGPVGSQDSTITDANGWHLEGKQVHIGLNLSLSHLSSCRVENAAVSEEASREASEDDDLILADLDDTSALSLGELRRGNIDDDPAVGPVLRVVSLDRVAVLLARLRNSAEDEDKALIVGAA